MLSFFFQAEDGIRDLTVTGVQTCALPISSEIHEITAPSSTPLIVNDHAEIAAEVPVEGVHVGQEDDSVPLARQKAGRDLIVGKSTHNLAQAHAAQGDGADYIGFGPIFATPT